MQPASPVPQSSAGLNRRAFLKTAGVALGATALACGGLGYAAGRAPAVDLTETTCGGATPMNKKILVAYATRAGSTVEIAETIGRELCAHGALVDVRPVKEVTSLDGYSAVVIGSAIRMGNWLPEAKKFVADHQAALNGMPTAFFVASLFLANDDSPENRQTIDAYLDPVRALHTPDAVGLFTGKMDYSKLSWLDRKMAKFVKAAEADHRDFAAIQAWAADLRQGAFAPALA